MNTERQRNPERTWLPGISAEYLSAVVQSSPLGFIIGTCAIFFDITEKMKLESALKAGLEKMNRVVDETVKALASAVETRDLYTASHQRRGGLPGMCYRRRNGRNWR